ncbi:hypothetical protein GEV33_003352 [Tenebrio molitor]|uniref:Uncharacterized protein n=1 Tax=Tenebrio molitor TaxID=7067 RepID=A0A8J6HRL5_TENMO|nr:hypothetical protein GEV33_003352 [Tenebrio molitor]
MDANYKNNYLARRKRPKEEIVRCWLSRQWRGAALAAARHRCGTVKGAETARKGCGDVEDAEGRIPDGRFVKNQTPECGVKFHARISSSTVGPRKSPRKVQVSRDVDRPVTIKARVIEKNFTFREASASF